MKFQEIINSDKLVLVDFFATWCGPCKMMVPILADLKKRIGENATIINIDVDKNPQVAKIYQVSGVPTLMLFKAGKTLWRKSGVLTTKELENLINAHQ